MAKHQASIMGIFGQNPSSCFTAGEISKALGERPENVNNDIRLLAAAGFICQPIARGPYELASFEALRKFFEESKRPTRGSTRQAAAAPKAASPEEKTDAAFNALCDALEAEGIEAGPEIEALQDALKAAREAAEAAAKAAAAKEAKKAALRAALEQAADDEALSLALSAALAALG